MLLLPAAILPSLAILVSDERLGRILEAFGNLFSAILAIYLALVPLVHEKDIPFVALFVITLAVSLVAAVSAVALTFFDGANETKASQIIQMLLGPVLNYSQLPLAQVIVMRYGRERSLHRARSSSMRDAVWRTA